MAEYLETIELGGFYQKGRIFKKHKVLKRPEKPLNNPPQPEYNRNDIPQMCGSMANYFIGDTPNEEEYRLRWHKIHDEDKTLLICDRNILVSVSWNDLNEEGYIFGKHIIIDGVQYLCRVLTGGNVPQGVQEKSDAFPNNEWDRFICCKEPIAGIPKPQFIPLCKSERETVDLESISSFPKELSRRIHQNPITEIEDKTSENNRFWNWADCSSWCQERVGEKENAPCVYRGHVSGKSINVGNPFSRHPLLGFRPVLEISTNAPLLSDNE